MRSRLFVVFAFLLVALLPQNGVRADEAPEPAPPPDFDGGAQSFQQDVEPTDLLAYMKTLRRSIEEYKKPAPKTDRVTALYDAWYAILRPRAARMTRRVKSWEAPKRWYTPPGERAPTALDPDQWSPFTRDMAALVTELHGAWKQYGTVKLKQKEVALGPQTTPRPPRLHRYGYPYATHRRGFRDRQVAGWNMGRGVMGSYWHLLNRFQSAWLWRLQRRAEYDAWWRKQARIRKQTFQELRNELNNTRDALGENMLGVQALVAAMQNAEEERLFGTCTACQTDNTLREMAQVALRDMEDARLDAENYDGDSSSRYGTLLRKWLRMRKAAVKVLELANEKMEEEATAMDEEPEPKETEPAKEGAHAAPPGVDPQAAKDYADAPVPAPVPFAGTDLRGEAAARGEFDDLPPAKPDALVALFEALEKLGKEAKATPGRFVGDPAGGSYVPTKAEIRLAELGGRVEAAMALAPVAKVREAWRKAGFRENAVSYKTFSTVTVKVFGTGYVTVLEPRARAIAAP